MTIRLFRRVRIAPGMRMNLSRSGVSLSVGRKGMWYTSGRRGQRVTAGAPGTGLFWTQLVTRRTAAPAGHARVMLVGLAVLVAIVVALAIVGAPH